MAATKRRDYPQPSSPSFIARSFAMDARTTAALAAELREGNCARQKKTVPPAMGSNAHRLESYIGTPPEITSECCNNCARNAVWKPSVHRKVEKVVRGLRPHKFLSILVCNLGTTPPCGHIFVQVAHLCLSHCIRTRLPLDLQVSVEFERNKTAPPAAAPQHGGRRGRLNRAGPRPLV